MSEWVSQWVTDMGRLWSDLGPIKTPCNCIVELVSAILQYGIVQSLCHQYERDQKKSGARWAVDIWYPDYLVPLLFVFALFWPSRESTFSWKNPIYCWCKCRCALLIKNNPGEVFSVTTSLPGLPGGLKTFCFHTSAPQVPKYMDVLLKGF